MSLSFLYIASPQQGDLRLSGPPSGQGVGSGARTRDRRVPADLRAASQATVLPTPQDEGRNDRIERGKDDQHYDQCVRGGRKVKIVDVPNWPNCLRLTAMDIMGHQCHQQGSLSKVDRQGKFESE
ncbi:hypothetical protein PoB_003582800 [Plakobranchus ocellatus]|uniref:Uncharacterized protein n=1 Tax=Plakobranchus ocellatus TaxID=259542 RepID=A0AAV4APN2_9GAST|nr:hypothetical protein PoB_003582800 [Plakobranchus ocellatus]